jgi:hypothetical protein
MQKLSEIKKAVVAAIVVILGTITTAIATQDWTPVLVAAITGVVAVLGVYKAENEPAV